MRTSLYLFIFVFLGLSACGSSNSYIPGTTISPTEENDRVIYRLEEYRLAMEKRDTKSLVLMVSKRYWEDSGTSSGEDDYGYKDLLPILTTRLQSAESIRYSLRYDRIRFSAATKTKKRLVFVDVIIDASFSIPDSRGGMKRMDKRDQGQFVLEFDDNRWMFLSGM